MLEKFRIAKAAEIAMLVAQEAAGTLPAPLAGPRPSFSAALLGGKSPVVIAEYKRASPSLGDINLDVEPEDVAAAYAVAGASAISVLTEEEWFKGSLAFLPRMLGPGLPLLRKDFILHPLQVVQTAATPASAYLLIVRMLPGSLLQELLALGRQYGLEAVVEVFDATDLARAQAAGASIIQVNNRDLDTLKTDTAISQALITAKRPGECWITASGISSAEQLHSLLSLGYDAALVGSALMAGDAPGGAGAALRGGLAALRGASHG